MLAEQHGLTIAKTKLVLDEPIKACGGYQIRAKLGYEVVGTGKRHGGGGLRRTVRGEERGAVQSVDARPSHRPAVPGTKIPNSRF